MLYIAERASFSADQKLAKFGICGKIFVEICPF